MAKHAYVNLRKPRVLPKGADVDEVKVEFANRLQRAMVGKGFNQSELARAAALHMPISHKTGKPQRIGRDNISTYVTAKVLPGPAALKAMARALGKLPEELLPAKGVPSANDRLPEFQLRDMEDGMVWMRVNQAVPWPLALKIAELLRGKDGDAQDADGHVSDHR